MRVHSMAARLCSAVVLVLVASSLLPVHGSSHDNDATVHQVSPQDRFQFWVDYPGSPLNKVHTSHLWRSRQGDTWCRFSLTTTPS